jgi:hypothetical protein
MARTHITSFWISPPASRTVHLVTNFVIHLSHTSFVRSAHHVSFQNVTLVGYSGAARCHSHDELVLSAVNHRLERLLQEVFGQLHTKLEEEHASDTKRLADRTTRTHEGSGVSREGPSHSGPETPPQRFHTTSGNRLPRTVQKTGISPCRCRLDSRFDHLTHKHINEGVEGPLSKIPTSGGIAIVHIATPAVPPAKITALRLRSFESAGVNHFFVTSYAAKYL